MKKTLYTLVIILVAFSCSDNDKSVNLTPPNKPSEMKTFCLSNPNESMSKVVYQYQNGNLITQSCYSNSELAHKITFEYNSRNDIICETFEGDRIKQIKTYIYNSFKQLINIKYKTINYDENGKKTSETETETPREYNNNLLVKEWAYCGAFSTYEYKNNKVVKKIDYTTTGQRHHITYYKYSDDLLIEEKKETVAGAPLYFKTYSYDSQNRVVTIKDGKDVIEENKYLNNRLIEKRVYYFGIDPGFAPCNGNYIYKFKY